MKYDFTAINHYRNLSTRQEYLSAEEERELLRKAKGEPSKESDEARDRLIRSHLRLAIKYAIENLKKVEGNVLSMDDLVQEATAALCYAITKFDVDVPVRFATYAKFWIHAYLSDHIHANSYQIKYGMSNDAKLVAKLYIRERTKHVGKGLTEKEINQLIANDLNVSFFVVDSMASTINHKGNPKELDRLYDDESGNPPMSVNLIDEGNQPDLIVEDIFTSMLHKSRIKKALVKLKPRERDIIKRRYMAEEPDTLETLGKKYNISKERIRQLEHKSLKILKKELSDLSLA